MRIPELPVRFEPTWITEVCRAKKSFEELALRFDCCLDVRRAVRMLSGWSGYGERDDQAQGLRPFLCRGGERHPSALHLGEDAPGDSWGAVLSHLGRVTSRSRWQRPLGLNTKRFTFRNLGLFDAEKRRAFKIIFHALHERVKHAPRATER